MKNQYFRDNAKHNVKRSRWYQYEKTAWGGQGNAIIKLPQVATEFREFVVNATTLKVDWMPCPRCGSKRVIKPGFWSACLAGFATVGCLLWIPIIGWVLAPIIALMTPILGLAGTAYQCSDCKFTWTTKDVETYQAGCVDIKHEGIDGRRK